MTDTSLAKLDEKSSNSVLFLDRVRLSIAQEEKLENTATEMSEKITDVVTNTGIQHQVRKMDYSHYCQFDLSSAWGYPTHHRTTLTNIGWILAICFEHQTRSFMLPGLRYTPQLRLAAFHHYSGEDVALAHDSALKASERETENNYSSLVLEDSL